MRYCVSALVLALFGFAADAAQTGRPAMSNRGVSSPRYTASVNQITGMAGIKPVDAAKVATVPAAEEKAAEETTEEPVEEEVDETPTVDMREAERNACINNNVGIGNTFVWASRYSDTSNYVNMVEDAIHPENNVCFVRVELNSTNESRVKVSDIAPKYFMWDETIKCGSWVDKKEMEKRILEARKGARIGGIVASTVGGMGLGVGAMELFGNKLIGGKVEGQKSESLSKEKLYKSQLSALKKKDEDKFNEYMADLKTLSDACDNGEWHSDNCSLYKNLVKELNNN